MGMAEVVRLFCWPADLVCCWPFGTSGGVSGLRYRGVPEHQDLSLETAIAQRSSAADPSLEGLTVLTH